MRLSCQEQLLPGDSLQAKFEFALRAGFDGIELRGEGDGRFAARLPALRAAARAGVVMATVCPWMDHFIGDFDAAREGVWLAVEPLNRYEDHMVNRLEQAIALGEEVERQLGVDAVRVCADLFHMNIEEDDLAAAIVDAGPRLAHVHVDDSNRQQPGTGHLNFAAAFGALRAVGYRGWLTLECRLRGDPAQALPATRRFLASLL